MAAGLIILAVEAKSKQGKVLGYPQLHSKVKASLGYTRPPTQRTQQLFPICNKDFEPLDPAMTIGLGGHVLNSRSTITLRGKHGLSRAQEDTGWQGAAEAHQPCPASRGMGPEEQGSSSACGPGSLCPAALKPSSRIGDG